jgi:peroxiredoxin
MAEPDPPAAGRGEDAPRVRAPAAGGFHAPRYGRYVALLAIVIVILITINTIVTKPHGLAGLAPGERMPPFAVPLATGTLEGDANIATRYHQGEAGHVPACSVHEAGALNICKLYEEGPVVLALFVDKGGCTRVLTEMQALISSFPQVRFAAVAVRDEHEPTRKLVGKLGLTFPVGFDEDGALAALYKLATCPQVTFALRGGVVQSKTLLDTPAPATLRERIAELLATRSAP